MTLLVALGMPGIMSFWGTVALGAIASEAFDDHCVFQVETLEDMQNAWKNRTSENVIITSHYPDTELCEFLLRTNAPYVIFSENAVDCVTYLARQLAREDIGLIRSVSASIACISQMRPHPFLMNLNREKIGTVPIHRVVGQICRQLRISLTSAGMVQCLKQLGMDDADSATQIDQIPTFEKSAARINSFYAPPGENPTDVPPNLLQIARDVVEPFDGKLLRDQVSSLIWPQESFLLADKGGEPAGGEIELVGRARCLVYGPYFHLPSGEWNATYSLGIEENVYGQIFTIEVHSDGLLSKIRVRPTGTGSFAAEAAFRIDRPKNPIEIRLFTDTGSIEGSIAYWSVELSPIDLTEHDSATSNEVIVEAEKDGQTTPLETINHVE
jgi:hypothetical protein